MIQLTNDMDDEKVGIECEDISAADEASQLWLKGFALQAPIITYTS